jgi:hypothetical protein
MSPPRSNSPSLNGSYESDHSSDNDDTKRTDEPASSNQYQKPKPYSDQKHLKGKGNKPTRPTHFLCFPLVTEASVPQLAESLGKFRAMTTAPVASAQQGADDTPEREVDASGADSADGVDDKLKIIPSSAHRPPGTFHLTIGTMDLSQKSDMLKAVKVLKGLEYGAILQKVDTQLSPAGNPREIALDATGPAATIRAPDDQLAANGTASTSTNTSTAPAKTAQPASPPAPAKDSYRSTVSKIDRAILHATPDTRDIKAYKQAASTSPPTSTPLSPTSPTSPTQSTPAHRRELSQLSSPAYHNRNSSQESAVSHLTTSSIAPSIAQSQTSYAPSTYAPSIASSITATGEHGNVHHGNRYGVSGYKETVSTIDRYVDKTYDTAQRAKAKARTLRPSEMRERIRNRSSRSGSKGMGLESLRRDVSPPGRHGSVSGSVVTERRGLLDDGASTVNGDAGSLYTVNTNTTTRTDATERPQPGTTRAAAVPASALDERPMSPSPPSTGPAAMETTSLSVEHVQNQSNKQGHGESSSSSAKIKPITISLSGLGTFPSPSKARVFYAPPSSPTTHDSHPDQVDRLLAFANELKTVFMEQGILRNEGRELVLHATVANMSKATSKGGKGERGGKGRWKPRADTIDARDILAHFNSGASGTGSFTWASDVPVDRVRICKMGAIKADTARDYMRGVDREVLGMVYPAIEVDGEGEGEGLGKVKAEVSFA